MQSTINLSQELRHNVGKGLRLFNHRQVAGTVDDLELSTALQIGGHLLHSLREDTVVGSSNKQTRHSGRSHTLADIVGAEGLHTVGEALQAVGAHRLLD